MSEERSWPELQAAFARGELVDEPLLLMLLEPPQADVAQQPPTVRAAEDAANPRRDAEAGRQGLLEPQGGGDTVDAD
jgi:hypothetical protein